MKAYTDYPITELGDISGKKAPIRSCVVVGWDDDKYCKVVIGTVEKEIKAGYLYKDVGRCGGVQVIDTSDLPVLKS
tara:strand:- start:942 stop:1169 length:228 start_codon:yes stop_codon:yes gene_type:complete